MRGDKRKNPRKPLERHVWIDAGDGSPLTECVLGNMSETGAKLVLKAPAEFPKEFVLLLTKDGRVARKCRVAWTADKEVGLVFVARLVPAESRTPAPA
jgi:hypothetical protein